MIRNMMHPDYSQRPSANELLGRPLVKQFVQYRQQMLAFNKLVMIFTFMYIYFYRSSDIYISIVQCSITFLKIIWSILRKFSPAHVRS